MDPIPPPVMPVEPTPLTMPPGQAQGTPPPTPPKKPFDMRYVFVTIIILALVGGIVAVVWRPKEEVAVPTPTPTPSPTPVQRVTVPLATQSAYRTMVASVASLSSSINTLQLNDTTLSPPVIELSLGFPN